MPVYKYKKPTSKVTDVYRGKEMETLVQGALQKAFANSGINFTPAKVKRFLRTLSHPHLGGNPVLIIEHLPVNSMQAHGKIGKLVFQVVGKTGNQYAKPRVKPHNPRTVLQQTNRGKMPVADHAWQMLSPAQKESWRKKARNTKNTGFQLFISNYMLTH